MDEALRTVSVLVVCTSPLVVGKSVDDRLEGGGDIELRSVVVCCSAIEGVKVAVDVVFTNWRLYRGNSYRGPS